MQKTILIAAGIGTLLAACSGHGKHAAAEPSPLAVGTAVAECSEQPRRMSFVGKLSGKYDAVIQPRVSGYLTGKHYADGMPVKRGQLLFTVDGSELSSVMASAEAALYSARAEEAEARSNYERAVPLAGINAISKVQLEQYATRLSAAKASLRSAEQALRRARLNYGYAKIYAPVDGIISSTRAHEGDLVGPGSQFTTLATISNVDSMTVDISIPMSEYLQLSGREQATYDNASLLSDIRLTLADGTPYPYPGTYDYTRKDISDAMGSIIIAVIFPNPDATLKPGQFARVAAGVGLPQKAVLVPQRAVSQTQGTDAVWVVRPDSTVEYRRVRAGGTEGGMWRIDEGLSAGERVATSGLQKMHDGMKVAPQNI